MDKLTEKIVNNAWDTITGIIDNLRTMIRSEVKEKGEYIIPTNDEMISPCIHYNGGNHPEYASNVFSRVESIKWDSNVNDVIIHTEDGVEYLTDCDVSDVMCLAETLAYFNEYGYHEDDEE